jgi:hypothetical protein
MELRFAHIADYAAIGIDGKLTLVGAFDIIWDVPGTRPIAFPPFSLVVGFEASIAEGPEHELHITLTNDDEETGSLAVEGLLQFRPHGPGHPARANALLSFGPGAVAVPELGDYHFVFAINGKRVGSLRVSVLAPQPRS